MRTDEILAQLASASDDLMFSSDAMRCTPTPPEDPAEPAGPDEYPVQIVDDTIDDFLRRRGLK